MAQAAQALAEGEGLPTACCAACHGPCYHFFGLLLGDSFCRHQLREQSRYDYFLFPASPAFYHVLCEPPSFPSTSHLLWELLQRRTVSMRRSLPVSCMLPPPRALPGSLAGTWGGRHTKLSVYWASKFLSPALARLH